MEYYFQWVVRKIQKPFAIPVFTGETVQPMQSPTTTHQSLETTPPVPARKAITEPPDFSGTPKPIEEFAVRANFPQCALGAYLDIRGFAGVVVEIVNQSIKVSSPEGVTQRFNIQRLKMLCAPPERTEPMPSNRNSHSSKPAAAPELPPRVFIVNPNFTTPVRPINDYARSPDFPKCAYGKHVDVVGYSGVVVEIVKGSLKVQSLAGITRSYNGATLKKLYGKV